MNKPYSHHSTLRYQCDFKYLLINFLAYKLRKVNGFEIVLHDFYYK